MPEKQETAPASSTSTGRSAKANAGSGFRCPQAIEESVKDDFTDGWIFKSDKKQCEEKLNLAKKAIATDVDLNAYASREYKNRLGDTYLNQISACTSNDPNKNYLVASKAIYDALLIQQKMSIALDQIASIDAFIPSEKPMLDGVNCNRFQIFSPELQERCETYKSNDCAGKRMVESTDDPNMKPDFNDVAAEVHNAYIEAKYLEGKLGLCAFKNGVRQHELAFAPVIKSELCSIDTQKAWARKEYLYETYPFIRGEEFKSIMKDLDKTPLDKKLELTKTAIRKQQEFTRKALVRELARSECRKGCYIHSNKSDQKCSFQRVDESGLDTEEDICEPEKLNEFFSSGNDLAEVESLNRASQAFGEMAAGKLKAFFFDSLRSLRKDLQFTSDPSEFAASLALSAQSCLTRASIKRESNAEFAADVGIGVGVVAVGLATGGTGLFAAGSLAARGGLAFSYLLEAGTAIYYTSAAVMKAKQYCTVEEIKLRDTAEKNKNICPSYSSKVAVATRSYDKCIMESVGTFIEGAGLAMTVRGGRAIFAAASSSGRRTSGAASKVSSEVARGGQVMPEASSAEARLVETMRTRDPELSESVSRHLQKIDNTALRESEAAKIEQTLTELKKTGKYTDEELDASLKQFLRSCGVK